MSIASEANVHEELKKYSFYHVIDLGDGIKTPGRPDLVPGTNNVLQAMDQIDFAGKRVLDIGTHDGLFALTAERSGAEEVIGIDRTIPPCASEFLIPYLDSKVQMFEMNMFDLTPDRFGMFDVRPLDSGDAAEAPQQELAPACPDPVQGIEAAPEGARLAPPAVARHRESVRLVANLLQQLQTAVGSRQAQISQPRSAKSFWK